MGFQHDVDDWVKDDFVDDGELEEWFKQHQEAGEQFEENNPHIERWNDDSKDLGWSFDEIRAEFEVYFE